MSRLLLDTHALLWWLFDAPQLSRTARKLIASRRSEVFVSSASVWEIAIKQRDGKLRGADVYLDQYRAVHAEAGLQELPIAHSHAVLAGTIPWTHKDPFDRVLVAQSRLEGMELITKDEAIRAFHPDCRW